MATISATDLGLTYPLPRRALLAANAPGTPPATSRIVVRGRDRLVLALEGIGFELDAGDRLALTGPNGAGKTTLLKLLYGIYEPTAGCLTMAGRADALFNLGLGFRRDATGRRNIELRGLINGWSRAEITARTEAIVAFSGLGEFIDLPMRTYSQGMAARLAFSIATSFAPDILLMDEWIGAGDAEFQAKAARRMSELAESASIVVLASHNRQLLQRVCNKRLELDQGRLRYFGPI
jgi:ABC-type polysaccharide/polyol phosphate transport system ATPase subunit